MLLDELPVDGHPVMVSGRGWLYVLLVAVRFAYAHINRGRFALQIPIASDFDFTQRIPRVWCSEVSDHLPQTTNLLLKCSDLLTVTLPLLDFLL